jgi:sulfatase-like protein
VSRLRATVAALVLLFAAAGAATLLLIEPGGGGSTGEGARGAARAERRAGAGQAEAAPPARPSPGTDLSPAAQQAALRRLVAASSHRPPRTIVMVVFDELPLTSLLDSDEDVDDERYPTFARLAREAFWFRGATAVHDSTALAVPAILDGRYPRPGLSSDYTSHPRNLFTLLAPGYDLHVSEEATGLCPPSLCTPTPGTTISHVGHGKVKRFDSWLHGLEPEPGERVLDFKHVLLPHVPWKYLPSGLSYRRQPGEPIPGLNGMRGFGNPWLVQLSYQRHLLQLGFADRLLGQVVHRLKALGLWHRALFVVVADHGIGFHVGVERRAVTPHNLANIAPVPLFVKLPGQPHGLTVDRHVETIDVLPTILTAAHVALPQPLDGRSLLRPTAVRHRQVTIYHRIGTRLNTVGGRYTLSPAELVRARRAAVERKLAMFGSGGGREPRRLFEIGPYPALVGKRLDRLELLPGKAEATVDQAAELRDVDPGSGFVPAELTGTVPHGRPGGGRAFAISVNGRVAAVGRTFSLEGSTDESFAAVVPGWTLQPGANDVRVYEVTERAGKPALRPL